MMTKHDRNQYLLSAAAMGMSALAMFFAFLELRSSDRQLEADVWPYVDLDISLNSDSVQIIATNKGMGPALIHEFRVVYQDEEVLHPLALLDAAGVNSEGVSMTNSSLSRSVLASGERSVAMALSGPGVGLTVRDMVANMDIEICYCSVNDSCWNNLGEDAFRQSTERCEAQTIDVDRALGYFDRAEGDAARQADESEE